MFSGGAVGGLLRIAALTQLVSIAFGIHQSGLVRV